MVLERYCLILCISAAGFGTKCVETASLPNDISAVSLRAQPEVLIGRAAVTQLLWVHFVAIVILPLDAHFSINCRKQNVIYYCRYVTAASIDLNVFACDEKSITSPIWT